MIIPAIIVLVLFIVLLNMLANAEAKNVQLQAQLVDVTSQRDALDVDYRNLHDLVAIQGLLHAPVKIEVVVGNKQFPKGHVFKSTREALRALGKPSDSKLPQPNERGTIEAGDLVLRRLA